MPTFPRPTEEQQNELRGSMDDFLVRNGFGEDFRKMFDFDLLRQYGYRQVVTVLMQKM